MTLSAPAPPGGHIIPGPGPVAVGSHRGRDLPDEAPAVDGVRVVVGHGGAAAAAAVEGGVVVGVVGGGAACWAGLDGAGGGGGGRGRRRGRGCCCHFAEAHCAQVGAGGLDVALALGQHLIQKILCAQRCVCVCMCVCRGVGISLLQGFMFRV